MRGCRTVEVEWECIRSELRLGAENGVERCVERGTLNSEEGIIRSQILFCHTNITYNPVSYPRRMLLEEQCSFIGHLGVLEMGGCFKNVKEEEISLSFF